MLRCEHGGLLGSRLLRLCRRLVGTELRGTSLRHRVAYTDAGRSSQAEVEQWICDEGRKRGYLVSSDLARRLIEAARGHQFRGYARPERDDIQVVLTWYSPCGYQTPRANFETVLSDLLNAGIRVIVAEAVMPGAKPLSLPSHVRHLQWHTDSVLFLKENLFNLSLEHVTTAKVVLLDGDVRLSSRRWLDRTSDLLDSHDVCQPFEECYWLTKTGGYSFHKRAVVEAFSHSSWPCLREYHPGFAWGFRTDWLRRVGGIYDLHAVGGGDTSLAFALCPNQPPEQTLARWVRLEELFHETPTFRRWLGVVRQTHPRAGYLRNCVCVHLWHGSRGKRRYDDRSRWLPPLENGDYPVVRGPDGIVRWTRQEHSDRVLEYFRMRDEDE